MLTRIAESPDNRSFFLFGPHQAGKSSLVHAKFGNDEDSASPHIDHFIPPIRMSATDNVAYA
jgi:GTPase SAR1 family protein